MTSVLTVRAGITLHKPAASFSLGVSTVGALDALARGLAIDLAPVRVNVVCPWSTVTEVSDSGGYYDCDDGLTFQYDSSGTDFRRE